MKCQVIRSFLNYKRGQIFDPPDGAANVWIKRGLIEPVKEKPEFETMTVGHESENAMIEPVKTRKVFRR